MEYFSGLSIQEAAADFANSVAAMINAAAADLVGVDVMWFRAVPDKRSQDVIFQSYTLYGVNDCPLTFRAVYGDSGYDDAAITYNIMGLEYAVPLTLDIALETWGQVTDNDGSLPQRGDIVFIPISKKLVEVVSMKPVKSLGGQITSYKVNCSVYKPTRSRLVGENLKDSIEGSTVNLMSEFGKQIDDTLKNIVDNPQISAFTNTSRDISKKIVPTGDQLSTDKKIRNIFSEDITVDGHIVARNYYDMDVSSDGPVITYTKKDKFGINDERCYSAWVSIKDHEGYRNIKELTTEMDPSGIPTGTYIYITSYTGKRFGAGERVVIERGNIVICGVVEDGEIYRVKVHPQVIKGLNKNIKNWQTLTGYIIRKDNEITLLDAKGSDNFRIVLRANNYIVLDFGGSEILIQLGGKLKCNHWYGFIVNLGKQTTVDVYDSLPELRSICSVSAIKNKYWKDMEVEYSLDASPSLITNIRLYDVSNNEVDKQVTDLVSYITPYNSHAIINDNALTPMDNPYIEKQR